MASEDKILSTYCQSFGMIYEERPVQGEKEDEESYILRKDTFTTNLCRSYLELFIENDILMDNLIEFSKEEENPRKSGIKITKRKKF